LLQIFTVLMVASLILLVVACANAGSASLARTLSRRGEVAIRLALGATRFQVVRVLVIESLLLAGVATGAALAVSRVAVWALEGAIVSPALPPLERAALDANVVICSVAAAAVAAAIAVLSPALAVRHASPLTALRGLASARKTSRLRLAPSLMTLQVAASLVLLVGAVLLLRSTSARLAIDPGFEVTKVRTFRIDPRRSGLPGFQLRRAIVDRMRDEPGVTNAAVAFVPPYSSGIEARAVFHTGDPTRTLQAALNSVTTGFFDTIGLPFVAGRDFTSAELMARDPVRTSPVILSESLARRAFGHVDVVGEWVMTPAGGRRVVVGVVRQTRQRQLDSAEASDIVFQPYRADYRSPFVTVVVRTETADAGRWPAIRRALADVDPALVMFQAETAEAGIRAQFGREILAMRTTVVFGLLAMTIAAVGLYAALDRVLVDRRRELRIRSALGASPSRMAATVAVEVSGVIAAGVAIGLLVSVWLSRFLEGMLFGVSHIDPLSYATAVCLVLLGAASVVVPKCRKAARTNPVSLSVA
jgi:predicted permease